jgi:hypothetical protein
MKPLLARGPALALYYNPTGGQPTTVVVAWTRLVTVSAELGPKRCRFDAAEERKKRSAGCAALEPAFCAATPLLSTRRIFTQKIFSEENF